MPDRNMMFHPAFIMLQLIPPHHINSYKRKKLNNRSPYETFSFYYGEEVLKKLGCSPVAAENIILKPKLLKK